MSILACLSLPDLSSASWLLSLALRPAVAVNISGWNSKAQESAVHRQTPLSYLNLCKCSVQSKIGVYEYQIVNFPCVDWRIASLASRYNEDEGCESSKALEGVHLHCPRARNLWQACTKCSTKSISAPRKSIFRATMQDVHRLDSDSLFEAKKSRKTWRSKGARRVPRGQIS